jgi:hypothetical protein
MDHYSIPVVHGTTSDPLQDPARRFAYIDSFRYSIYIMRISHEQIMVSCAQRAGMGPCREVGWGMHPVSMCIRSVLSPKTITLLHFQAESVHEPKTPAACLKQLDAAGSVAKIQPEQKDQRVTVTPCTLSSFEVD